MKTATHPQTAATADALRRHIAARRDQLIRRQRRQYVPRRAELIDQLGQDYRAVLCIALTAGVEEVES